MKEIIHVMLGIISVVLLVLAAIALLSSKGDSTRYDGKGNRGYK
jgi:hypothetical protein